MPPRLVSLVLAAVLAVWAPACSGDDDAAPTTSSTTSSSTSSPSTSEAEGTDGAGPANSAELEPLLITAGDLPEGFVASAEVDDTITSFCATHDAASGLQATERAVVGFAREGGGASVLQLVFRFRDGDAERFLAQAEAAMAACDGVPDGSGTGLAFEYEPLPPEAEGALAGAGDGHAGALGTSVGSGSFVVAVAVVHHGDVGVLVAVLGLDQPRAELASLAETAFAAAAARLG